MKSILTFSALASAALTTSAVAFPRPSESLFVSRMVRRQVLHHDSTLVASTSVSTCGDFALQEPQKLQVRSYNDSTTAYLSVTSSDAQTQLFNALPPSSGSHGACLFDFQTCNYQGFTQGFSRNSGGSMGAPLEFWGRVVTNVTITNQATQKRCLAALPAQDSFNASSGLFKLDDCNDADSKQWFRLQEGIGGAVLSYFPVKNKTGYVYGGQTPEYFRVDLHPNADANNVNAVAYTGDNSQQYVRFD